MKKHERARMIRGGEFKNSNYILRVLLNSPIVLSCYYPSNGDNKACYMTIKVLLFFIIEMYFFLEELC